MRTCYRQGALNLGYALESTREILKNYWFWGPNPGQVSQIVEAVL